MQKKYNPEAPPSEVVNNVEPVEKAECPVLDQKKAAAPQEKVKPIVPAASDVIEILSDSEEKSVAMVR